jgi:hypothetical protein
LLCVLLVCFSSHGMIATTVILFIVGLFVSVSMQSVMTNLRCFATLTAFKNEWFTERNDDCYDMKNVFMRMRTLLALLPYGSLTSAASENFRSLFVLLSWNTRGARSKATVMATVVGTTRTSRSFSRFSKLREPLKQVPRTRDWLMQTNRKNPRKTIL